MIARKLIIFSILAFTQVLAESEPKLDCKKNVESQSPTLRLKRKILCNYDKEYRPIKDQNKVINVTVRMVLRSINFEDYGQIGINSWMGVMWKDEYLQWKKDDFENINLVHLSTKDIWSPDLQVYKESGSLVLEDTDCLVYYTGIVICVASSRYDSDCVADLRRWPYDTQTCSVPFTAELNNIKQVFLKFHHVPIITDGFVENPAWELLKTSASITNSTRKKNTHQHLNYNFTLRRHSSHHTASTIVPSFTLICLTLVPLWLEVGSAERMCLSSIGFLTHFLFIANLQWLVSWQQVNTPIVVQFFRDSLVLSIIVLMESAFLNTLMSSTWLVRPCRFIANGIFGKTLMIEYASVQEENEDNGDKIEDRGTMLEKIQERSLISNVLDRLLFFLLVLIYLILFFAKMPL